MKKSPIIVSLCGSILFIACELPTQVSSAEQLSHGYSKDRSSVYYRDYKLGIEPQEFEVINEHWVKNHRHVYFMFTPRNGQEIESWRWSEGEDGDFYRLNSLLGLFERPVDPASFNLIADYLAVDKNQAYYFNTRPPVKVPAVLRGANPETLEIIDEDYARDENSVFYTRRHFGPCTIEQADPKTFTVLSERYSKDIYNAFHNCSLIQNADSKTFRVTTGFLAEDSKNVFRSGKLVSSAKPGAFNHPEASFQ